MHEKSSKWFSRYSHKKNPQQRSGEGDIILYIVWEAVSMQTKSPIISFALCFPSIHLSIYQYTSLTRFLSFFLLFFFAALSKLRTILFYGIAIAIVAIFIYSFSDVKCVSWLFACILLKLKQRKREREQNKPKPRMLYSEWARVRAAKTRAKKNK